MTVKLLNTAELRALPTDAEFVYRGEVQKGIRLQFFKKEDKPMMFGGPNEDWYYFVIGPSDKELFIPVKKDAEELYPITLDLQATSTCSYCRKLLRKEDSKQTKIFVNRGTRYETFCKEGPCAGYYQMGCEG